MDGQKVRENAEALIRQYQLSGDLALREQLVRAHLYMAGMVARRFAGRGVEYDDLYQVASLALLKALERFDPDKGVRFITFAAPTLTGEVKNYFRDKSRLITLPRRGAELAVRVQRACAALESVLGRMPTPVELAQHLDEPLDAVLEALEMRLALSPASLDAAPPGGEAESSLGASLGQEEEGFAAFERQDQVRRLLARLAPQERKLMQARYFQGLSQREAAQQIGVSQMTVSRMEKRILTQFRAWMTEGEKEHG